MLAVLDDMDRSQRQGHEPNVQREEGRLLRIQHDRKRIRTVGRVAATALLVHDALQREPVTTIARLAARTGLSAPGATAALQRLVALDLVNEVSGRQWGRVYSYAPYVQILSEGSEPLGS